MLNRCIVKTLLAFAALLSLLAGIPEHTWAAQAQLPETDALGAAVLMAPATETRLWGREPDTAIAVAGLSKLPAILTLTQAFDEGLIAESATMQVSAHAAGIAGPTAFLESGERIAARELIKAAVMISAGDAIMTLGENAFGSESVFVENIGVTMRQIGLDKTTPDALYSGVAFSAWELATLGAAACRSATFSKYCALYLDRVVHQDGRETELVNANRMIKNYSGCGGLLTGSSPTDGYSGIFCAQRNGTELIAVVGGAQSAVRRTAAAVALLDYGFANFRTETLAKPGASLAAAVPVRAGRVKSIDLVAMQESALVLENSAGKLTRRLDVPDYLEAPLASDVAAGSAAFFNEAGEQLAVVPLYPAHDVEAFGVRDILLRIIGLFVA